MALQTVWRKVRWSLQQRGWKGTLYVALGAVRRRGRTGSGPVHPFDLRYGTETGGVLGGGSLAVGSRNDAFITAYAGVVPSRLRTSLQQWRGSLRDDEAESSFTFVDLGCGKGRALLLAASEFGFRQVFGVELNPALVTTARENLRLFGEAGLLRCPVTAEAGDATEVRYPAGACLVFIYNSFGAPVVRSVLEALERHVQATGARVDLLFQNESPETPTRTDGRLKRLWTAQVPMSEEDAAAEPVGSPEDVTSLYRWVG